MPDTILLVDSHWVSLSLSCDALSAGSKPSDSGMKCTTATEKESDPTLDSAAGNSFTQEVWLLAILHLLCSDDASKFSFFFYFFVKQDLGLFHFITT